LPAGVFSVSSIGLLFSSSKASADGGGVRSPAVFS
jgi:hypothetical protein